MGFALGELGFWNSLVYIRWLGYRDMIIFTFAIQHMSLVILFSLVVS